MRSLKEFTREQKKLNDAKHITSLICYDIEDDKLRRAISKILEQRGFYRVQKSVFLGRQDRKRFKGLWKELREFDGSYSPQDSVVAIPLTEASISNIKMIGEALDLDLILDRKRVMII